MLLYQFQEYLVKWNSIFDENEWSHSAIQFDYNETEFGQGENDIANFNMWMNSIKLQINFVNIDFGWNLLLHFFYFGKITHFQINLEEIFGKCSHFEMFNFEALIFYL